MGDLSWLTDLHGMGFTAINEAVQPEVAQTGESYEAKEQRVVQLYEEALLQIADGAKARALVGTISLSQPQQAALSAQITQ